MMATEQVVKAALPEVAWRYLGAPPYALELLQENVYCLRSATERLFLKWISAEDPYGENEVQVNRQLGITPDFPGPRLLFTVPIGEAILAGWEWAAGSDLRQCQRQALPRAFAQLGLFHALHRNAKPVYGPATRQLYPAIGAMLDGEVVVLTRGLESAVVAQCREALHRLDVGYVTWIHGDLHPGNIRVAADRIQFVDWGYAANSLNLFDLGYVERHQRSDAGAWWHIGPSEADAVLAAYFATNGMGNLDQESLVWAVEVWSTLDGYHNAWTRQNAVGVIDSIKALHVLLAEA